MTPDDLLGGRPLPTAVFEAVLAASERLGGVEVRTTKSQIAFRRRHGFAFLWLPGQYLSSPDAEVAGWLAEAADRAG